MQLDNCHTAPCAFRWVLLALALYTGSIDVMGVLDLWDTLFSKIKKNDKLHLAWCVGGVIGCLVLYGVLQVTATLIDFA